MSCFNLTGKPQTTAQAAKVVTAIASDAVTIRPAVESDVALIYSPWLRSYWNATACHMGIDFRVYQEGQRARIGWLLASCGATVACSPEAPDTIMGWVCAALAKPVLHYVYVRQIYRRAGVAAMLMGQARGATHMTPTFARCFPKVKFNPYLLEQI